MQCQVAVLEDIRELKPVQACFLMYTQAACKQQTQGTQAMLADMLRGCGEAILCFVSICLLRAAAECSWLPCVVPAAGGPGERPRVGSSLAQATLAVSDACSVGLVALRQRQGSHWQGAHSSTGGNDCS